MTGIKVFAYVYGKPLVGDWIDLYGICSYDELKDELVSRKIIPEDYDQDILIADYEGLDVSENQCINWELLEEVKKACKDGYPTDAIEAYIYLVGSHYFKYENFYEAYQGAYDSMEDFAEEYVYECYDIPDYIDRNWLDFEHIARELRYDYNFQDGFVFRSI